MCLTCTSTVPSLITRRPEIAISALFRRLPDLRLLSPASLRWRRSLFLRGLERLPLVTESGMARPERPAA